MKKSVRGLALLSTAALALGVGVASPANASEARATGQQVLARGVPSPLSLAVAKGGSAYVTADFAGMLWHVARGRAPEVVYQTKEKNGSVSGVSRHRNKVTFAVNGKKKLIKQIKKGGKATTLADIGKYEATQNPDKGVSYGLQGASAECLAQWPEKDLGPATYQGIVDSNPYATYTTRKGVYVADAAMNSILWVNNKGRIKTVGLLPPTPVTITAEAAAASKIPACAVGLDYNFEPVPTDVEVGPNGALIVSSLPGGPEDGSLGAQGRVYRMHARNGTVKFLAGGFISTVDVAVANNGDIYVAELFTGMVKRLKLHTSKAKPFLQLTQPGAIEWTKNYLYATDNALIGQKNPKGKVIRVKW